MRLSRFAALFPSVVLCLVFLFPAAPAEAKPRGRKWESLGIVGNPGDCYEIWVRHHWLHGWQIVHEPVPCPDGNPIAPPRNIGVGFSGHPAFMRLSDDLQSLPLVFGKPVPFVFQASNESMGPVLCYGEKASLLEFSADGEAPLFAYQEPVAYVAELLVPEGSQLGTLFTGPYQAALVTLSEDALTLEAVHAVITVSPQQY